MSFSYGMRIKDSFSGEVGKVEKSNLAGGLKIWLMESDSWVWRSESEVTEIPAYEYEQACFEWELRQNNV